MIERLRTSDNYTRAYFLLILLVLGAGIAIRVFQFPAIPPGFSQDEAIGAYDSFSLGLTGQDRWGHTFPAYFPSWGSGQNVLLAYLSIPFIKLLGLNVFAVRLPALLLGILTLPLFFFCLRPLGRYPAFLGLLLLAVVPWHFMLSRWASEANTVPFFMLLGCVLLTRALITGRRRWIIPSLTPFALALYAYGTTVIILPVLFSAILLLYYPIIRRNAWYWGLAFVLFSALSFPFALFFTENYLLGKNISWTDNLLFSTPMLVTTRLSQAKHGEWGEMVRANAYFIRAAFSDGSPNHVLHGHKTLLHFTLPLILLGPLAAAHRLIKHYRQRQITSEVIILSVFAAYELAALAFIFLFNLNVNRFNHFYLPCLALCAWALPTLIRKFVPAAYAPALRVLTTGLLVWQGFTAIYYYFTDYPQEKIRDRFNVGLGEAFASAEHIAGVRQILITRSMPLPDAYTLFFTQYPPDKFRREVQVEIKNGEYKVNTFGRYVFYPEYLNKSASYGYLARKNELRDDSTHHKVSLFTSELWEVGIMRAKAR